jgi:hypothetical protein
MAVRASCPHCGKNLKLRQAPLPGRRLLCSGCDRTFLPQAEPAEVPAGALAAVSTRSASPAITPLPASVLTPIAPPAPPEDSLAEARQPRRLLLLGIVLGVLLLLTGSTALALHLAARADSQRTQAALSTSTTETIDPPAPTTPPSQPSPEPADRGEDSPAPAPGPDNSRAADPPPVIDRRPRGSRPPAMNTPAPGVPGGERGGLPGDVQQLVNKAIDQGVEYLKKTQKVNGTWDNQHTTALAALPGLTLMECGVPAADERVQKAARFVRSHVARLSGATTTYQLSLALLFLDRLGDPKDEPLIRTIAARLVAGQSSDGGWTYTLPQLATENEKLLLRFLEQTRPLDRFVPFQRPGTADPLDRFVPVPGSGVSSGTKPGSLLEGSTPPIGPGAKKPGKGTEPAPKRLVRPEQVRKAVNGLPMRLRNIPAVVDAAGKAPTVNPLAGGRTSDNSNTQFATLALWAARRYNLPLERSIDLLARRFKQSQLPNGTWQYHFHGGHQTPAMTGAGLLGLAVGHGLEADPSRKKTVKDEQIDRGIKALGSQIGKPFGADVKQRMKVARGRIVGVGRSQGPINLYFLWTVERVGVLYHVREMDGKDWYRWGVELLLPTQARDGSWHERNYHGSTRPVDTCFALLFLKRANLAADLTKRLEFAVEGKPAAPPAGSLR